MASGLMDLPTDRVADSSKSAPTDGRPLALFVDDRGEAAEAAFATLVESTGGAFNFIVPTTNTPTGLSFAVFTDGTSNTALLGEIKRGEGSIGGNYKGQPLAPYHARYLNTSWGDWGGAPSSSNPVPVGLLVPPANCNANVTSAYYAGTAYYRDHPGFTSSYTHTAVPNSPLGDCMNPNNDAHVAARGYHPGGVNIALCDGSVRFVKGTIALPVWKNLGTRGGGEVISADQY